MSHTDLRGVCRLATDRCSSAPNNTWSRSLVKPCGGRALLLFINRAVWAPRKADFVSPDRERKWWLNMHQTCVTPDHCVLERDKGEREAVGEQGRGANIVHECVCLCVWEGEREWVIPLIVLFFGQGGGGGGGWGVRAWYRWLPLSVTLSVTPWLDRDVSSTPLDSHYPPEASQTVRLWEWRKWRPCRSWPADTDLCPSPPWEVLEGLLLCRHHWQTEREGGERHQEDTRKSPN